jgi:small-conductance mechanosensitive channel
LISRTQDRHQGRIAVDLLEQRQLELARQMAKVKARARPWRAMIALVLAVAAAGVSYAAGHDLRSVVEPGQVGSEIVTASLAGAFLLFGIAAVVGLAGQARRALEPLTGSAHASVIRYSIVLIGAVTVLAITLALCKIPVGQFIVGGALTTILIGIAAQQTLSNVFAGIVLLLSRPFNIGDPVVLRSGALGGQYEGMIAEVGITYVRLDTGAGAVSLPNSQVLAAAVSRQAAVTNGSDPAGDNHPSGSGQPNAASQAIGDGHLAGDGQPVGDGHPNVKLLPPSGAAVQDGGSPAS